MTPSRFRVYGQPIGHGQMMVLEDYGIDFQAPLAPDPGAVSWHGGNDGTPLRREWSPVQAGKHACELVTFFRPEQGPTGDLWIYPYRHKLTVLSSGNETTILIVDGKPFVPRLPADLREAFDWVLDHGDLLSAPATRGRRRHRATGLTPDEWLEIALEMRTKKNKGYALKRIGEETGAKLSEDTVARWLGWLSEDYPNL